MFVPDCSDALMHDQFARLPLKMDAPEKVLSQAHGQAGRVVDFLHENGINYWLVLTLHYLLSICTIFLLDRVTQEILLRLTCVCAFPAEIFC